MADNSRPLLIRRSSSAANDSIESGFDQTTVKIVGNYSSIANTGYWSIGCIPHVGIYFGTQKDLVPYYLGFKALEEQPAHKSAH